MNTVKNGNLIKAVAFFVIVAILALTLVIVANGWQDDTTKTDNSDAEGNKQDTPTSGDADNDTPPQQNSPTTPETPETPEAPMYLCPITGLETVEQISKSRPLVFTIDTNAPTYGISSARLIIEVPFENGTTRSLLFTYEGEKIGKLGSITYTRDTLLELCKDFGGLSISLGNDSNKSNETTEEYEQVDLGKNTGYHYTEYASFCYTNGDLVKAMITNLTIDRTLTHNFPFKFTGYFDTSLELEEHAANLSINYGVNNKTYFAFDKDIGEYILSKNTLEVRDLLNDKKSSFTNIFILFADSTTYETDKYTETVLDLSCGEGLYFTNGKATKILWSHTEEGNFVFLDQFGVELLVNRGTSYISFVKASMKGSVEYS